MRPPNLSERALSSVCLCERGICHGTAVALKGCGALLLGQSGAGKSALALDMIARGAALIADDRTICTRQNDEIRLSAPPAIAGMIEARGIGLLKSPAAASARLTVVVDLDRPEPERLPPRREISCAGLHFPLILGRDLGHLGAALMVLLQHGWAK